MCLILTCTLRETNEIDEASYFNPIFKKKIMTCELHELVIDDASIGSSGNPNNPAVKQSKGSIIYFLNLD